MQLRKGILGGTFDPIHNGHLRIAEAAADAFSLDEMILLPSGFSYFKAGREDRMMDPMVRYEMTVLAAAGNSLFSVSDIECRRAGNTYTSETLRIMKEADPDSSLFFITGADALMGMRKWHDPETLFSLCTVGVCSRRRQTDPEELDREIAWLTDRFGAVIERFTVPDIPISSEMIRERLRSGLSISGLVPPDVEEYIIANRLYSGACSGIAKQQP